MYFLKKLRIYLEAYFKEDFGHDTCGSVTLTLVTLFVLIILLAIVCYIFYQIKLENAKDYMLENLKIMLQTIKSS